MWIPLLTLFPIAHAAPSSWESLVIRAAGVDGHRAPAQTLAQELADACPAHPLACTWSDVAQAGSADWSTLGDAASIECSTTAPVACLVQAWAEGRDPTTREWRTTDEVPPSVRESLTSACSSGLQRACVELGWTEHLGIGTYVQADAADARWSTLCSAGDAAACSARIQARKPGSSPDAQTLERAVSLGSPIAAVLAVGTLSNEALKDPLEEACRTGVAQACVELARMSQGEDQVRHLATACATTDPSSCARLALLNGQRSGTKASARALRAIGPDWADAYTWANLVELGVPLDPFTEPADLLELHAQALQTDARTSLQGCYQEALAKGHFEGWYDIDLLTDGSGNIVSGTIHGDGLDPTFQQCTAEALTTVRALASTGRPRLAHVRVGLNHTSALKPMVVITSDVETFSHAAASVPSWTDALSVCGVGLGYVPPTEGVFRIVVSRKGAMKSASTTQTTGDPTVDTCIRERLMEQSTNPLQVGTKFDIRVNLLVPKELAEPEPVYRTEPTAYTGEPTPYKVLLWFVDDLKIDRHSARFTKDSQRSVEAAFEQAATWVQAHTGGAVDVQIESRSVGSVSPDELGDRRRGTLTWNVRPSDLPSTHLRDLERHTWDAIHIWAPIPRGAPRPFGYVIWRGSQVYGATVTTSTLEEGRDLLMLDGTASWVFALQMFYDGWQSRSEHLLGKTLPKNTTPLVLAPRHRLDPRIGLSDDPREFYEHVFHNDLPSDLWATLRESLEQPLTDGNLAYAAQPVGHDTVTDLANLADGLWEAGTYDIAAHDLSDGTQVRQTWFGLRWDTMHTI